MDIQQNSPPYSTWVQTLLTAVSKNFAHKDFLCNSYFEEGDHIAKAMFYQLTKEKFGEEAAIAEFTRLWPKVLHGTVMSKADTVLASKRYVVKRNLIKNYLKIYEPHS